MILIYPFLDRCGRMKDRDDDIYCSEENEDGLTKMINIVICDDEKKDIDKLRADVENFFKARKTETLIITYTDGENLIKERVKADIIFLDVEMKGVDGIKTAEKIRQYNMNVPIVYVTNYADYWRRAYSVHAFEFIVKPYRKEIVEKVLSDYMRMVEGIEAKRVLLNTVEGIVNIKQSDIYYFLIEKKKHVSMTTVNGIYMVRENLRDIYEKLDEKQFYMSHKSCIINLCHVERLENRYDIIMENGEFVPLAQNKRADFLKILSTIMIERIKGQRL